MELAKVGAIKNPLTIIAIFAGIAEISGTLVLPHISSENQYLYIWFLMSFPSVLVVIFFLTLNFNHRVLYAPSDFRDEKDFLSLMKKASIAEVFEKATHENDEAHISSPSPARSVDINPEKMSSPESDASSPAQSLSPVQQEPTSFSFPSGAMTHPSIDTWKKYFSSVMEMREIERFAICKTANEMGIAPPQFDMKIGDGAYVFDAFSSAQNGMIIWEAFQTEDAHNAQQKADRFLAQVASIRDAYGPSARSVVTVFILAIYGRQMSFAAQAECTSRILKLMRDHNVLGSVIGIDREGLSAQHADTIRDQKNA